MIGILGGMGTQAGLDFCNKLTILNRGKSDQEYPMFILYNKSKIPKIPENLTEKAAAELNSSIFSSALGLATRKLDVFGYYEYVTGTNNINLLPNRENVKNQEKMKFFSRWGIVIFVIIAIAMGVWNFLADEKEVDRRSKEREEMRKHQHKYMKEEDESPPGQGTLFPGLRRDAGR